MGDPTPNLAAISDPNPGSTDLIKDPVPVQTAGNINEVADRVESRLNEVVANLQAVKLLKDSAEAENS